MIAFHTLLPELAQREVRCLHLGDAPGVPPGAGLPPGEYAFVEFYCEDLNCDCRRVFLQVFARHEADRVLASINYGWEDEAFYRQRMPWDPEAPREVVQGALDPMNPQSEHSAELLELFQRHVLDEPYRLRLRRHYQLFRDELRRRQTPPASPASAAANEVRSGSLPPRPAAQRIPAAHQERFAEVAALIEPFGQAHLDAELTGFVIELWSRICRRKSPDCLRGKPAVWAAAVTHVIARMNFLFDRAQPVHVTFDTLCNFFQVSKTTVGGKATGIERALRLQQHSEPGLCRREFLEAFTMIRLANGMVLTWSMARQMGVLPADARVEDLR
jgi:hypothetical protein